ncbi:hypothetical protein M430DRAFT_53834 [Amorphotheca resinae ATCC 22711]|uniref:Major facilitator superfamily (MFS) profile domain-containing protein n=1 Tax=Amorphotheca resinae ATCC 22711 TaxID=857342 RepID=A0A2T3ASH7_AMORE|nr:hypothetical protein M430DRAFT_53834 [Amorphotheca resinae ATCC 22711]PSS09316.1 hypothetical protein M430DRAFT_53834 [Amorphotheca resinae ATCC 22711]
MTAEMVREKKYQSRAFLLLPLVFNTGNVVGLAVGGLLADPVVNLAWLFGPKGVWNIGGYEQGVAWMRAFPFALPTIFNACVLFCSLCLAVFGLRETMPGWTGREDVGLRAWAAVKRTARRIFQGRAAGYSALETSDSNTSELSLLSLPSITSTPETSTRPPPKLSITSRSIYTRRVLTTILSFALFPLHNSAFMNLFPIFLSTPPSPDPPSSPISFTGGLGLPASQIGLYLSTSSIYGILIQMLIYPRIHTRLRTLRTYRLALSLFPLPYLLVPYLALLPPSLHIPSLILLLLLQVSARTFAIPSSIILLTNAAAAPHHLSAVHGVGNMANALARALGPIVGGAAFAWGLEHRLVGFAWWVWVAGISIVGLAWSFVLNEEEEEEGGLEKRR